ncbi:glycosyltransferase family 4 protein [Methanobacterium sp.]|uniref:glycosyltransferase family 4 protein n=1 Tax=Methanobacterium sp. TaxID=2164 RepID=UPI003C78E7F1
MDIGLVHPELIYPRGAEKQLCKLSYYLDKMGHEVTIYTFEKEESYLFNPLLENVNIISLNTKWVLNYLFELNQFRWANLIRKISSKIGDHDIINAHNHPAQWISNFTDIPTVWMCNEPYHKQHRLDNYLSSKVKSTLSISAEIETMVKDRYPQMQVETVGSGAGLDRKIEHIENEYFDLVFVGPLHPKKHQLDIINAFSLIKDKIPNARLHFVGGEVGLLSKRLKNSMIELAQKNQIEILFYDSITDEELYSLYDLADISVFVPESEPWGIFPLETMLGGINTIISDQCGAADVLPNNKFVIETGNIKQLANKILDVKENFDEYNNETMIASKIIRENYSWKAYSKRMENIFCRFK